MRIASLHVILILLISNDLALGQRNQFEPYFVKSRNIDIKFQDTVIEKSILTIPTGEFQFVDGHDLLIQKLDIYRFTGRGKQSKTTKDSLIKSQKSNLNIKSYFPLLYHDSSKVIFPENHENLWTPHYDYETEYSYILSQSGYESLYDSQNDSTIRIVIKESGIDNADYIIFTVDLSGNDFIFHCKKIKHTYDETFNNLFEIKGKVKKEKVIQKFYKQFAKYNFTDSTYLVKENGLQSALIEFKTKDNYKAIVRTHADNHGKQLDPKLTWTMYELLAWSCYYF
jgi:hypothetical protein